MTCLDVTSLHVASVDLASLDLASVDATSVAAVLGGDPNSRGGRPGRARTFHPRRGRVSGRHLDALERLWPIFGVTIGQPPADAVDLAGLFGRCAPVVLEIGSGMGEATARMAADDPGRDYLAVEVHTPGIANLLALLAEHGLTNVRIAAGDALDLLWHQIRPDSLDAVHVYFPDPWPKSRHHKRRLIQAAHVALLRSRLSVGGRLHCATDCAGYAEAMLATLAADVELVNEYDGFAPRPLQRPLTKYEQRGVAAGRSVFDLVFRRDGLRPGRLAHQGSSYEGIGRGGLPHGA